MLKQSVTQQNAISPELPDHAYLKLRKLKFSKFRNGNGIAFCAHLPYAQTCLRLQESWGVKWRFSMRLLTWNGFLATRSASREAEIKAWPRGSTPIGWRVGEEEWDARRWLVNWEVTWARGRRGAGRPPVRTEGEKLASTFLIGLSVFISSKRLCSNLSS